MTTPTKRKSLGFLRRDRKLIDRKLMSVARRRCKLLDRIGGLEIARGALVRQQINLAAEELSANLWSPVGGLLLFAFLVAESTLLAWIVTKLQGYAGWNLVPLSTGPLAFWGVIIMLMIAVVVFIAFFLGRWLGFPSETVRLSVFGAAYLFPFIMAGAAVSIRVQKSGPTQQNLETLAFGGFVALVYIVGGVQWYNVVQRFRRRRLAIRHPDAAVCGPLLQVLRRLETSRLQWSSSRSRSRLLADIESASRAIEYGFPRCMRTGDGATNHWAQQQARQMSAAMRSLKQWIVTPQPETYAAIRRRIRDDIVCISLGEWGKLPRTHRVVAEKREVVLARLWAVVKAILVGGTPMAALIVLQHRWPSVEIPVWGYLTASAWALYQGMRIIEPSLIEQAEGFKKLFEGATGGKKGKD